MNKCKATIFIFSYLVAYAAKHLFDNARIRSNDVLRKALQKIRGKFYQIGAAF
jgi:hypothetical protein